MFLQLFISRKGVSEQERTKQHINLASQLKMKVMNISGKIQYLFLYLKNGNIPGVYDTTRNADAITVIYLKMSDY